MNLKTTLLPLVVLTFAIAVPASAEAGNCGVPYVTHTCVVKTHTEYRWAKDACGRRYSYEVLVTTYRSHFSNGQTSTFARATRLS